MDTLGTNGETKILYEPDDDLPGWTLNVVIETIPEYWVRY